MRTDLDERKDGIADIIRICGLDGDEHRVSRAQLESLTNLGIQLTRRLVMRADNGLAQYWRERAESAEAFIRNEKGGGDDAIRESGAGAGVAGIR